MEVRFATPDVAVVTVPSRMSTFTSPDGVTLENEGRIRTFVVVKRLDRRLMEIQSLTISERIILAKTLWDSVVAEDVEIYITAAQREELDRRLAAFEIGYGVGPGQLFESKKVYPKI